MCVTMSGFILFLIVCIYLCVFTYMCVQVPLATRGCRFSGSGLLELNSGPLEDQQALLTAAEPSLQPYHIVSWKLFIYSVIFAWLLRLWEIALVIILFAT